MTQWKRRIRWSIAPVEAPQIQRNNFLYVQIDAIGIGLANTASSFLPVFLTRLGASNFEVGLLTAMPAAAGLMLAILVGNFLQSRHNIVPWFSVSRLLVVSSYAVTGIAPFIVSDENLIRTILLIWAVATIPQTAVSVGFSVVMNAVAGPKYRYDLMSRRWSILGLTTAISVAIVGQVLDQIGFSLNYQIVFIGLSLGGLISFIFSSRIKIPDATITSISSGKSFHQKFNDYIELVKSHPDFIYFSIKRFVFFTGQFLAVPLFPLYYVREVNASDTAIGLITTSKTAVLLLGYFLWTCQTRKKGSHFVILITTLGLSLYPVAVGLTTQVSLIIFLAGLAGIFQAGVDLVFFDELMKTVPIEYSATFVSIAQSLQFASSMFAPILGTFLANHIGLDGGLFTSGIILLIGFLLFAFWRPEKKLRTDYS